jgi:glycosyltransferase involved in cell wall biosynthesis
MRVLFLSFQFPFPAISGASIKTLSLLGFLRSSHDVRLVSLRRKGALSRAQRGWAADFDHIQTVEINKPRNVWTLLSSYVARVPLRIERNRSPEMARLVREEIEAFDPEVLFADGLSMAQYVPDGYRGLRLLQEHNAEYVIWQRQSEIEKGARRWLAATEASRLRRYEASMIRKFDMVFAVSQDERLVLVELGAEPSRLEVLPNIPERELLQKPAPAFAATRPVILYFGTLSWLPNIEGLMRVLTSIFPAVRRRVPEAQLVVAGAGASGSLAERVRAVEGAEFRGEVEDAESLYRESRVLIDATRSGAGTRLKVLNALARGIPVIASTVAAEGLEAVPGHDLMVAGDDSEMIEAVSLVLQDAGRWGALSENGRALVRERYVAEVAYRPLARALERAAPIPR